MDVSYDIPLLHSKTSQLIENLACWAIILGEPEEPVALFSEFVINKLAPNILRFILQNGNDKVRQNYSKEMRVRVEVESEATIVVCPE